MQWYDVKLIEITPYPAHVESGLPPTLHVRVHPRPIFRSLESSPMRGAVYFIVILMLFLLVPFKEIGCRYVVRIFFHCLFFFHRLFLDATT